VHKSESNVIRHIVVSTMMYGTGKTLLGIMTPYQIAKLLLEGKLPEGFHSTAARLILEGAFVSLDCAALHGKLRV
jgi:hypothetical protein